MAQAIVSTYLPVSPFMILRTKRTMGHLWYPPFFQENICLFFCGNETTKCNMLEGRPGSSSTAGGPSPGNLLGQTIRVFRPFVYFPNFPCFCPLSKEKLHTFTIYFLEIKEKCAKESHADFKNGHLFLSTFHFGDGKFCKRCVESIMQ